MNLTVPPRSDESDVLFILGRNRVRPQKNWSRLVDSRRRRRGTREGSGEATCKMERNTLAYQEEVDCPDDVEQEYGACSILKT